MSKRKNGTCLSAIENVNLSTSTSTSAGVMSAVGSLVLTGLVFLQMLMFVVGLVLLV